MITQTIRLSALASTLFFASALWAADAAAPKTIDTSNSVMTVRVLKAGLFSAFGHEHEISAPVQQGSFTEGNPSVELTVDARKLKVMDKDVSDKDRAEIQQTMLGPKCWIVRSTRRSVSAQPKATAWARADGLCTET